MRHVSHRALAIAAVCVCLTDGMASGADQRSGKETLAQRLGRITTARGRGHTDLGTLERRALALLDEFSAPQDKGTIYATIANMYFQTGSVEYTDEIALFASKALDYPLPVAEVVRTSRAWGCTLTRQVTGAKGLGRSAKRREAAHIFLAALKPVLQHLTEHRLQWPPRLDMLDIEGSSPEVRRIYEEHRRRAEERRRIKRQNELLRTRDMLCADVAWLYTRKPYAPAELQELLASSIGDCDIADEIGQDVRSRNEGRKGVQWGKRLKWPPPPPRDPKIQALIDGMKREAEARAAAGRK